VKDQNLVGVMRRRTRRHNLIAALAVSSLPCFVTARAQQPAVPVIGYVADVPNEPTIVAALRAGLAEQGFADGHNLVLDVHIMPGQSDLVPGVIADFVRRRVAVIVTEGTPHTLEAAHAATTTIPVDAFFGADPVAGGYVASINRPGGNLTGVALFTGTTNLLDLKRLDLLRAMVPGLHAIGLLSAPDNPLSPAEQSAEQAAIEATGISVATESVTTESDLDAAFASLAGRKVGGLLQRPSAFLTGRRAALVALAAKYRIPASWGWPEFVAAGGLMSYGPSILDAAHQQGIYAGRILKGEKPGDLPVVLPSIYRLAINLTTAKALGLAVPPTLLAIADEVIE
jgi:putative tryptophan/tyrosine transport system substrate-binding protein